jgi:hypothetical protein
MLFNTAKTKGESKFVIALLALLLFNNSVFCQETDKAFNQKKTIISTSCILGVTTSGFVGLNQIWYKDYPKSKFHLFNDAQNWMQMDKAGHLYTANKLSHQFFDIYRWSGFQNKSAAVIGASLGLSFQTTLEIMDGYSSEWGFSWSDMAANTIGSLSFLSQQLIWGDEKIVLKFSVHKTPYATIRPSVLGKSTSEHFLKDYNGQTYWLSYSPHDFIQKVPKWLCLSFGYSVDQKLVGDLNIYTDINTQKTYTASRQYLFSLDIDFSKLPIKKPWLKKVVKQFNYIKLPFPTLLFQDGITYVKGFYF